MLSTTHPMLIFFVAGIIALVVGSFLTLLVYRLPLMLFADWRQQCHEFLAEYHDKLLPRKPFNLFLPRSQCSRCHQALKLWQNIPLLGFVLQRGKCQYCQQRIPWRYPLIELLTLALSLLLLWKFGFSLQTGAYLLLTWGLIALTFIDLEYQILPDEITYVLLWLGLALTLTPQFVLPQDAIVGVIGGYLSLWLIGHVFYGITKREGMGYGDYKLFAMFGAWLGWQLLPLLLLLAAILGIIGAFIGILMKQQSWRQSRAFAPYLALAGWVLLIWEQDFLSLLKGWLL